MTILAIGLISAGCFGLGYAIGLERGRWRRRQSFRTIDRVIGLGFSEGSEALRDR